jgi:hypothetical protein
MNAKKNNVRRENPVMMENLESRELYSVSLTPSIPIPPPSPTATKLVVVTSASDPAPIQSPGVVISIIAVLIGL